MTDKTEIVATFMPEGETAFVAWVVEDFVDLANIWEEVKPWTDDDVQGRIGTIRIERMPIGYVGSLPEFEGW